MPDGVLLRQREGRPYQLRGASLLSASSLGQRAGTPGPCPARAMPTQALRPTP